MNTKLKDHPKASNIDYICKSAAENITGKLANMR
jgi:hypothetical protein